MKRNLYTGRLKEIAEFAEDIALTNFGNNVPIDPFKIAQNDEIKVVGDSFNGAFDGMSELVGKQFVIFYDNSLGKNHPRVRFTVAHELAHCEIEEHRKYLSEGGVPFPCKVEFSSPEEETAEWEADTFASSLLLPSYAIKPIINEKEPSMELFKALADKMKTSLTSTLIRCVLISEYACAVIMLKDNKVRWSFTSEFMKDVGLSFIPKEYSTPINSAAKKIDFSEKSKKLEAEKETRLINWFENYKGKNIPLWEEVIAIPSTHEILVLLTLQDYEQEW